jgi:hypothetical protein
MKHVTRRPAREGLLLGVIWFLMSFGIDQLMFSGGPMRMGFGEDMADIGVTHMSSSF